MNAMYDAPIDAYGGAKYAGDRKAHIVLADHERPVMRIATMARGWRCRSAIRSAGSSAATCSTAWCAASRG